MYCGKTVARSKRVTPVVEAVRSRPRPRVEEDDVSINRGEEGGRSGYGGGGEEGGCGVRVKTRQVNESDRVTQQKSTIGTEPSVPLASASGCNTTTRLSVCFDDMEVGYRERYNLFIIYSLYLSF